MFKILNGCIICPGKLEEIDWLVPTFYTRSKITFIESFHTQSYSFNKPKSYMLRVCNSLLGKAFDFNLDCESKLRLLYLNFEYRKLSTEYTYTNILL